MSYLSDKYRQNSGFDCPVCGDDLHIDTGSLVDLEDGKDPIFFCGCGYDSEKEQKLQVNSTSTGQPFSLDLLTLPTGESKKKHFGEVGQLFLSMGRCPYCDTDEIEGFLFGGSDDREGGLLDCPFCKVRISWIDNPFEAQEQWYED